MPSRLIRSRRELLALRSTAGADDPVVHIASLIVQIVPTRIDALREAVAAIPGAELHASAHPGKAAVLLEATDERSLADATQALHDVSGVLTVSIVAHVMERESALSKEIDDESPSIPPA